MNKENKIEIERKKERKLERKKERKVCLLEAQLIFSGLASLKGCNYVGKHLHTNLHCPHYLKANFEPN